MTTRSHRKPPHYFIHHLNSKFTITTLWLWWSCSFSSLSLVQSLGTSGRRGVGGRGRIGSSPLLPISTTMLLMTTHDGKEQEYEINYIRRDILSQLSECQTGTCARKVLYNAILLPAAATKEEEEMMMSSTIHEKLQKQDINNDMNNSNSDTTTNGPRLLLLGGANRRRTPLYQSISIPKGASSRTVSDADLALWTNIRSSNSKYTVMELIDLKGDSDANRASFSLFLLFVASSVAFVGLSQLESTLSTFMSLLLPLSFWEDNRDQLEIWRFVLVALLNFSPLIFVGLGLAAPESLQSILITLQNVAFPISSKRRLVHHEAGHFLMAHLLGYPIQRYQTSTIGLGSGSGGNISGLGRGGMAAVEFYPLRDEDVGREKAALLGFDSGRRKSNGIRNDSYSRREEGNPTVIQQDRPYFSKEGRGKDAIVSQSVFQRRDRDSSDQGASSSSSSSSSSFGKTDWLSPKDDVTQSWPFRGFDHETLDQLAVVSVAGVCSEILAYGNAQGGYADFVQLRALMASAEPELSEKDIENRIRYAIGFAMGQLRRHLGVLDVLVEAMERGDSVEECILAMEGCCEGQREEEDVSYRSSSSSSSAGSMRVVENYEKERRKRIQKEGMSWLESTLLRVVGGRGKNADDEQDGDNYVVEGKGGGDRQVGSRRNGLPLSGDDPLYAALGVALLFLVYATNGGISLH